MTTLKVGIADPDEMKARSLRIARGEEKPREADPKTLEMLLKVSALESRQYQLLAQLGGASAQGAAGPSGAAPKLLK